MSRLTTRNLLKTKNGIDATTDSALASCHVITTKTKNTRVLQIGTTKMTRSMKLSFKDLKRNSRVVREKFLRRKSVIFASAKLNDTSHRKMS